MKYFVGTALGKKTSTVLGNALGTAQGGATCIFFFIHVGERYASASTVYIVFHSPGRRSFWILFLCHATAGYLRD